MLKINALPRWLCALSILMLGLLGGISSANAISVTYALIDLRFTGPAQNGYPMPVDIFQPGVSGHFEWNYVDGNFAGGSGVLLDLTLPITSLPLADATTAVELSGLTGTYPPDLHGITYDFVMTFSHAISAPGMSTSIDPRSSTFDFTGSHFGSGSDVEWMGNISGTVSPVPELNSASMVLVGLGLGLAWCLSGRARRVVARGLIAGAEHQLTT